MQAARPAGPARMAIGSQVEGLKSNGCWARAVVRGNHLKDNYNLRYDRQEGEWAATLCAKNDDTLKKIAQEKGYDLIAPLAHANPNLAHAPGQIAHKFSKDTLVRLPALHTALSQTLRGIAEIYQLKAGELLELNRAVYAPQYQEGQPDFFADPWGSLHATGTKDDGRVVQLTGTEFTVGRKEACDLQYTGDKLISSVHAKLFVRSNVVWLEDCSSNGTYHNGTRVDKGSRVPLEPEDRIGLRPAQGGEPAAISFIFRAAEPAEEARLAKVSDLDTRLDTQLPDGVQVVLPDYRPHEPQPSTPAVPSPPGTAQARAPAVGDTLFVAIEGPNGQEWREAVVHAVCPDDRFEVVVGFEVVVDGDEDCIEPYGMGDEGEEWRWPPTQPVQLDERISVKHVRPPPPANAPDDFPGLHVQTVEVFERGGWWTMQREPFRDGFVNGSWCFGVLNQDRHELRVQRDRIRPECEWDAATGEWQNAQQDEAAPLSAEQSEVEAAEEGSGDEEQPGPMQQPRAAEPRELPSEEEEDDHDVDLDAGSEEEPAGSEEEPVEEEEPQVEAPPLQQMPAAAGAGTGASATSYDEAKETVAVLRRDGMGGASPEQRKEAFKLLQERFESHTDVIRALVDGKLRSEGLSNFAGGREHPGLRVTQDSRRGLENENMYLALVEHAEHGVVAAACVTLHRAAPLRKRRLSGGAPAADKEGRAEYWCAIVQLFAVRRHWERQRIGRRLIASIETWAARDAGAERLIVPSAAGLFPRRQNWWLAKADFSPCYVAEALDELEEDKVELCAQLPTTVFLPFSIQWSKSSPESNSISLLFKRLIPASYNFDDAKLRSLEQLEIEEEAADHVPSLVRDSTSRASGKRPAGPSARSAKQARVSNVSAGGGSNGTSSGAGPSGTAQPAATPQSSRKRDLVFIEFFAGSARLSRALFEQGGWDGASVESKASAGEDTEDCKKYYASDKLLLVDFLELNPASLPRCDYCHFSPDCASNSTLRRHDLPGGYERRGPQNGGYGSEEDEKAKLFNLCMDKIIAVIKDQRSRAGNGHFVFTVEQPDNGDYPGRWIEELENSVGTRAGCGATRLPLSFCKFRSSLFETLHSLDSPPLCNKPTIIWSNCELLISELATGRSRCGRPGCLFQAKHGASQKVQLPRAGRCRFHGEHMEQGDGGVRSDRKGTRPFPWDLAHYLATTMEDALCERRFEPETFAVSDRRTTPTEATHSIKALRQNSEPFMVS